MFNRSFLFVFSKLLFIIRMVIRMKSKIIENKKIKENVLGAITHPERNGLFDSIESNKT